MNSSSTITKRATTKGSTPVGRRRCPSGCERGRSAQTSGNQRNRCPNLDPVKYDTGSRSRNPEVQAHGRHRPRDEETGFHMVRERFDSGHSGLPWAGRTTRNGGTRPNGDTEIARESRNRDDCEGRRRRLARRDRGGVDRRGLAVGYGPQRQRRAHRRRLPRSSHLPDRSRGNRAPIRGGRGPRLPRRRRTGARGAVSTLRTISGRTDKAISS